MDDAFWHDKAFSWLKIGWTVLGVEDGVAVKHEEELVIVLVAVPVVLALQYAEANN